MAADVWDYKCSLEEFPAEDSNSHLQLRRSPPHLRQRLCAAQMPILIRTISTMIDQSLQRFDVKAGFMWRLLMWTHVNVHRQKTASGWWQ
jgi:hypothetical protein